MQKIALDSFTKKAVLEQITKSAGPIDWGAIGEGAGYGAGAGGLLGGVSSYLTSKEKDGGKRAKQALKDALTGVALGGVAGGGAGAVRHFLPESWGGLSTTTNEIRPDHAITPTVVGTKLVAGGAAPVVVAGRGAFKDILDLKSMGEANKVFNSEDYREKFTSKALGLGEKQHLPNASQLEVLFGKHVDPLAGPSLPGAMPPQHPSPFGTDVGSFEKTKAVLRNELQQQAPGNSAKQTRLLMNQLEAAKLTQYLPAVDDFLKTNKELPPGLLTTLETQPHLAAALHEAALARNPELAKYMPSSTGGHALSGAATMNNKGSWWNPMNLVANTEDAIKNRALHPEQRGNWLARNMPHTLKWGVPAAVGGVGVNALADAYLHSAEPDYMAKMLSRVDDIAGRKTSK